MSSLDDELRVSLVPMQLRKTRSSSQHTPSFRQSTSAGDPGPRQRPIGVQVVAINPDKGSFFHAMISYRQNTDATFVTNMHNAMNLVASQREDLRTLDDFPWPKSFRRAETTGASGVRIFLDKFCLRDGAQWEGSSQSSGGFVGALLKSLLFVPVFSVSKEDTFKGSLGQMAQIWNPLCDACVTPRVGRGFKIMLVTAEKSIHFRQHDAIITMEGEPMSTIEDLWRAIAGNLQDKLCFEVEREFSDKMFVNIHEMSATGFGAGLPSKPSSFADATHSEGIDSARQSGVAFTIKIDPSNKSFFDELGLSDGDEVVQLLCGNERFTAHSSEEFVTVLLRIAEKNVSSAKSPCRIRFKRAVVRSDTQDNVLLELILARELHMKCSTDSSSLEPCAALFPIFRSNEVFHVHLSRKASSKTNEKARSILQLNGIEPSSELKENTLSPHDVFEYFRRFQGIKAWQHGEEDNQIEACYEKVLLIIQDQSKHMESSFVTAHEGNTSQSIELRHWLQLINLSYYARVLAHNNVSSLHALSQLDGNLEILSKVAAQGAIASGRTQVSEYNELLSAVQLAKKSELSRPIEERFASFVDREASFMTASFSSRAGDIMLTKSLTQIGFFMSGVLFLAAVIYFDIPDFESRDEIKISSDLAAIVANCALISLALSYHFLPIKYARKSVYFVALFMFASRVPVFVLAKKDPCFSDVQCWIPQRVMSTIWIWSCAFFIAFRQQYVMPTIFVGGGFVFCSFGVMGDYSVFTSSTSRAVGAGCLLVSLVLFALYYVFLIMRRVALKKSAEISCEHTEAMDEVWAIIKNATHSGPYLSTLSPPNIPPLANESYDLFKECIETSLDVSNEDQIQSLMRVWETPTNRVLVKQEYTDIKRLFEEAEYCNGAFQVSRSALLAHMYSLTLRVSDLDFVMAFGRSQSRRIQPKAPSQGLLHFHGTPVFSAP